MKKWRSGGSGVGEKGEGGRRRKRITPIHCDISEMITKEEKKANHKNSRSSSLSEVFDEREPR